MKNSKLTGDLAMILAGKERPTIERLSAKKIGEILQVSEYLETEAQVEKTGRSYGFEEIVPAQRLGD